MGPAYGTGPEPSVSDRIRQQGHDRPAPIVDKAEDKGCWNAAVSAGSGKTWRDTSPPAAREPRR